MKPVFSEEKPEKKPVRSGKALKSRTEKPKSDQKKRWWIIGISAFLLCGIIGGVISLIVGNGALTRKVDVDDFISAFEDAGYKMEYDYDETLSDFEKQFGVSTGIDKFAAYTGERTHLQNGWQVDENIYSFYYIKCDDEESAAIIFDAIRDDQMYDNAEMVRDRDHSEKVRSESSGSTYVYNGERNYDKRCNIVSREGNVVVFVEVQIGDYFQYDIRYNYKVDEVLEEVGF